MFEFHPFRKSFRVTSATLSINRKQLAWCKLPHQLQTQPTLTFVVCSRRNHQRRSITWMISSLEMERCRILRCVIFCTYMHIDRAIVCPCTTLTLTLTLTLTPTRTLSPSPELFYLKGFSTRKIQLYGISARCRSGHSSQNAWVPRLFKGWSRHTSGN